MLRPMRIDVRFHPTRPTTTLYNGLPYHHRFRDSEYDFGFAGIGVQCAVKFVSFCYSCLAGVYRFRPVLSPTLLETFDNVFYY